MLKVVGAGLGRTGTHSLKEALEKLLGGPCYHMVEVFPRPEHVGLWRRAVMGESVDWDAFLAGFVAIVDWPGAAAWEEMAAAYPDAKVLLSVRDSAEQWWSSFSRTILQVMQRGPGGPDDEWYAMSVDMLERFTPSYADRDAAMAAYEAHNDRVRDRVPAERLIEWRPGDGWEPLCRRLGLAVPPEPFPVTNSTAEFRTMAGLDS